jgi:hypothetical protein
MWIPQGWRKMGRRNIRRMKGVCDLMTEGTGRVVGGTEKNNAWIGYTQIHHPSLTKGSTK